VKLLLRKPTRAYLERTLDRATHTSPELVPGAHFEHTPAGYRLGRTKRVVGSGSGDFVRACRALEQWSFLPRWARVHPADAAPRAATNVLLVVRTFFTWGVLPARILTSVDETTPDGHRVGFIYAALPEHVAVGYERFLVEHHEASGAVTFELAAVARPVHPVLRRAPPVFRVIQRRFRRACMHRMRRQVAFPRYGTSTTRPNA